MSVASRRILRRRAAAYAVLLAIAAPAASALLPASSAAADAPGVLWSPTSSNPTTLSLDFAEALLDRGVPTLADAELLRAGETISDAPEAVRARFARLSLSAILATSRLGTAEGRQSALERVAALRERVEGRDARKDAFEFFALAETLGAETRRYAVALAKAYYSIGALEAQETGEKSEALDASLELTRYLARSLPTRDARPFLYWHAKGTLANLSDPSRASGAEKFAAALEKSSRSAHDEYWFFAQVLLIETARAAGDQPLASRRIQETLAALKESEEARSPAAPREISAALAAQEIRLLQEEEKYADALRQAARDSDLLDAPFPENTKRCDEVFYDVFDDLNLARAELYWRVVPGAPTQKELDEREGDDPIGVSRETLVAEARRTAGLIDSPEQKACAGRLARDAGETSGDASTLELAAVEAYREGRWSDALEGYDRAATTASESGDAAGAWRLRAAAAALVDKGIRENLFPEADKTALQQDAAERFESLARERPEEELAHAFYRLALEYRTQLGKDDAAARFDYLTLFPTAPDHDGFALDLARRSLESGEYEDVRAALDAIPTASPKLAEALALERALCLAAKGGASDGGDALGVTLSRLLDRVAAVPQSSKGSASIATAGKRLAAMNKRLEPTPGETSVLEEFFSLALAEGAFEDENFAEASEEALAALRAASTDAGAGKLDALRLSAALKCGKESEALALLSEGANASGQVELPTLEQALALAQESPEPVRAKLAGFVLDALETEKPESPTLGAELARADALRLAGRGQESLNLFAKLRKENPGSAAASRGIARLLTSQDSPKALEQALGYWSDAADQSPEGSKDWWDAKEEAVKIYCRLGKREQAEKMTRTLWLTREDQSDPDRRRRWERAISESGSTPASTSASRASSTSGSAPKKASSAPGAKAPVKSTDKTSRAKGV